MSEARVKLNSNQKSEKSIPNEMQSTKIKIKLLNENALLPVRGSKFAAGLDLHSCVDTNVKARERLMVETGIAVQFSHQ